MYKKIKSAFTLIELLVVIVIIGILSGFIIVSLGGAINAAKDAKVKSDIGSIERAIIAYNVQNGVDYPSSETNCTLGGGTTRCTELEANLVPFLTNFPANPNGGFYVYNYDSGNYILSGNLSTGIPYVYNSLSGSWGNGFLIGAYKQQLTIPAATGAPANYPIKLVLNNTNVPNIATKMASDFHDLRFTDNTGNLIPYWVESYVVDTTATVWVNVPSISSGATIFMYYGTQSVSTSSGALTFPDFFDDFDNYSGPTDPNFTSKWNNGGVVSFNNSILQFHPSSTASVYLSSVYAVPADKAIESRFQTSQAANSGYGIQYNVVNGMHAALFSSPNGSSYNYKYWGGSSAGAISISGWSALTYYRFTSIRPSSTGLTSYRINNGSWNTPTGSTYTNSQPMNFQCWNNVGSEFDVDWVLVRPYVSTEPLSENIIFGAEVVGQ